MYANKERRLNGGLGCHKFGPTAKAEDENTFQNSCLRLGGPDNGLQQIRSGPRIRVHPIGSRFALEYIHTFCAISVQNCNSAIIGQKTLNFRKFIPTLILAQTYN